MPPDRLPAAPELLVTLDTGSLDRLGLRAAAGGRRRQRPGRRPPRLQHRLRHRPPRRRHGRGHGGAGRCSWSTGSASPLDRDIATGIYAGLVTDTGSFKYKATTPDVHRLAARLLETGLRHDLLTRALYDTNTFGYVRLLGAA